MPKVELMTRDQLDLQAEEILKEAQEAGVENNYFFVTTFQRYQVQIGILEELEKKIEEEGTLVKKEYVKGRKNLYCNPAVTEYNRTTDSANKTVNTLMRIIKDFKGEESSAGSDPLVKILYGGDEEE